VFTVLAALSSSINSHAGRIQQSRQHALSVKPKISDQANGEGFDGHAAPAPPRNGQAWKKPRWSNEEAERRKEARRRWSQKSE
jgi:hypothetical protein